MCDARLVEHSVVPLDQLLDAATLAELHDDPQNRFVAGFIGSPSMNLKTLSAEALTHVLNDPQGEAQASLDERGELSVGVRAHQLTLCELSELSERRAQGEAALAARVELVEPLGSESLIYCSVELPSAEPWRVVVRQDGHAGAKRGEELGLCCPHSALRFFSSDDEGRRLR